MDIYIIRHGAAQELDKEIAEDGYRYLSIHGRSHCKIIAKKLSDMKVKFDAVFSSPLVRAVQTAEIFSTVLKYEDEIITAIELSGGHTFTRFMQFLKRNSHHKSIGIFAHAPDVNTYSVNLIKNDNIKLNFKNLSVCKINYDFEDDAGEFIWFLNSDDLKLIEK